MLACMDASATGQLVANVNPFVQKRLHMNVNVGKHSAIRACHLCVFRAGARLLWFSLLR